MYVHSMYSSSSGNACRVFNENTTILIDAGVSFKKLQKAAGAGFKPDALFITHEHTDHTSGAGIAHRKTKCPIYMPEASYMEKRALFNDYKPNFLIGGHEVAIGDFKIKAFSTRHDCAACVGYTVTEVTTGKKFGYVTDSGSYSRLMRTALDGCDAYLLETDYDEQLLTEYEEYPDVHKDRIRSPWGHLSNAQTLEFVENSIDLEATQWILFGHLSPRTNTPETLLTQVKNKFPKYLKKFKIAPTDAPLEIT